MKGPGLGLRNADVRAAMHERFEEQLLDAADAMRAFEEANVLLHVQGKADWFCRSDPVDNVILY